MKYPKPIIHPLASKLVVRTLLKVKRETKLWNIRETARRLQLNPRYVFDNLLKGIEPTDRTEKGQQVRLKLGLKRLKSKPKLIRNVSSKPDYIKVWSHLPTDERNRVIKQYIEWRKNNVQ